MKKEQAKIIFYSLLDKGSANYRNDFFNSIGEMEFGFVGEMAKRLNRELNDEFVLGLDFGILIALDMVFGLRDES